MTEAGGARSETGGARSETGVARTEEAGALPETAGLRRVGLVAALVVVVAVAIQRLASRVFVLNFTLSGPNASAFLILGLVSVWTLPLARRLGWEPSLRAFAATLPIAVIISTVGDPLIAAVGAALVVALATPWLVALGAADRAFVPGLAAGVCAIVALRGWLGTLPATASLGGVALVVAVAFGAGALALQSTVPGEGASVVAWLAVVAQGLFLAFPAAIAAWAGLGYESTLVALVIGVVLGAVWTAWESDGTGRTPGLTGRGLLVASGRLDGRAVLVLAVVFALAWSDLVWIGELGWVAALVTQLAFVRLVAVGLRDDGVPWLGLAQTVAVLGIVGQVFAANWPFVPTGRLLAGHAPLALFTVGAAPIGAVVVLVLLGAGTEPTVDADGHPRPAGVDSDRRNALASVAPAALAVLSLAPNAIDRFRSVDDGATPTARPGDDRDPPYRALTLNVHQWVAGQGGGHNYHAVRDLLARTAPHLVGLQETEGSRYTTGSADPVRWLAADLDYHYACGPATRRGGYGVSILSKHPIEDASVVSLPVSLSPPRWAVVVTVDAPDGPLTVVSAHFQTDFHEADRQLAQAQTILGELVTSDTDRAIVLADCNVEPGEDPAYERLDRDLVDAWPAAGHDRFAGGETAPAWNPQKRIDYVWLDGDWSVSTATTVGDETVSDHLGVLATVTPTDDA